MLYFTNHINMCYTYLIICPLHDLLLKADDKWPQIRVFIFTSALFVNLNHAKYISSHLDSC